jgi:hypothetical protein
VHLLTALQDQAACDVLHEAPKEATYKETIGATEDRFGNRPLAVGSRNQLKVRTQDDGESLQKFATAIEQLTNCASHYTRTMLIGDQARNSATA